MKKLDELIDQKALKANLIFAQQSVDNKLSKYLLNMEHITGKDKAIWFEKSLGFTQENASELAKQIEFDPTKAKQTITSSYGVQYNQIITITITITGTNGRKIDVQFGWIKNNDDTRA